MNRKHLKRSTFLINRSFRLVYLVTSFCLEKCQHCHFEGRGCFNLTTGKKNLLKYINLLFSKRVITGQELNFTSVRLFVCFSLS